MSSAFISPSGLHILRHARESKSRMERFTTCAVQLPVPGGKAGTSLRVSLAPAAAYAVYFPYIFFFSSAHASNLPPQHPLWQALQLSLNFNFVLPLTFPSIAPMLSPVAEAIFNATVAYAILLVGFAADTPGFSTSSKDKAASAYSVDIFEREKPNTDTRRVFSPSTVWAVLLVPFLTNITWLPYLALRASSKADLDKNYVPSLPPLLARVSQSPFLPIYGLAVMGASILYGLLAHPSADLPAAFGPRLAEVAQLCKNDILCNSFAADFAMFALFQGWLVDDDRAVRSWTGPRADRAGVAAKLVPFFGLVWYLFERSSDSAARKF